MRTFFYLFVSFALIPILFTSDASSMPKNAYQECGVGILHGHPPTPFTPSDSPTDLAIDGNGFFSVRSQLGGNWLFTRFGNFHFDAQGYLVSSHGHIVQGWPMDESGLIFGSRGDIQISFLPDRCPPTKINKPSTTPKYSLTKTCRRTSRGCLRSSLYFQLQCRHILATNSEFHGCRLTAQLNVGATTYH